VDGESVLEAPRLLALSNYKIRVEHAALDRMLAHGKVELEASKLLKQKLFPVACPLSTNTVIKM
jgi:hypothetical protein